MGSGQGAGLYLNCIRAKQSQERHLPIAEYTEVAPHVLWPLEQLKRHHMYKYRKGSLGALCTLSDEILILHVISMHEMRLPIAM